MIGIINFDISIGIALRRLNFFNWQLFGYKLIHELYLPMLRRRSLFSFWYGFRISKGLFLTILCDNGCNHLRGTLCNSMCLNHTFNYWYFSICVQLWRLFSCRIDHGQLISMLFRFWTLISYLSFLSEFISQRYRSYIRFSILIQLCLRTVDPFRHIIIFPYLTIKQRGPYNDFALLKWCPWFLFLKFLLFILPLIAILRNLSNFINLYWWFLICFSLSFWILNFGYRNHLCFLFEIFNRSIN